MKPEELVEHVKTLLKSRNDLAQEVTTEGAEIITKKHELDTAHKTDCPCRDKKSDCTDTSYLEGMQDLETRIVAQKTKMAEVESLDSLIDSGSGVAERVEKAMKSNPAAPVTEGGMSRAATELLYGKRETSLFKQVGNDFHAFLQKIQVTKSDDLRSRPTVGSPVRLKDGSSFNTVASFNATFGENTQQLNRVAKSLGVDSGLSAEFDTAVKNRREHVKSMFTQHPLAGGDGSLYAPTEVFAGNTGGLCEYIIDDAVEVLPYPPVSFLECIPVRAISKPYVLYARQTLRINNASGVGEGVVLGADNPTNVPVDFRPIKPESEFGFSQAKAYTITFADTLAVSEEFLEDCPAIADAVETQLMENVRQEFYDQNINGDGSDGEFPEILGLLAQVGLSTRVHRGAATFFGNVMGAGAIDDNIRETIERAIFDGEAYGYMMDCVLMSHDDYIEMSFLKDEIGHRLYTDEQLNTIRGVKLRKDVRMPAGTAIVGAFRQVVQMLIRRAIRLDIGWIDKQFKQDMLTLRATMRGGLLVKVPHALIRVTGL